MNAKSKKATKICLIVVYTTPIQYIFYRYIKKILDKNCQKEYYNLYEVSSFLHTKRMYNFY